MPCGQLKKLSGSQCCSISLVAIAPKVRLVMGLRLQDIVREGDEGSPVDHAVVTQIRLHFAQELSHAFLMRFSSHFSHHSSMILRPVGLAGTVQLDDCFPANHRQHLEGIRETIGWHYF